MIIESVTNPEMFDPEGVVCYVVHFFYKHLNPSNSPWQNPQGLTGFKPLQNLEGFWSIWKSFSNWNIFILERCFIIQIFSAINSILKKPFANFVK